MAFIQGNFPTQSVRGPYFQGWNAIAAELVKMLSALSMVAKVHPYIKYVREGPEDKEFQDEFCEPSTKEDDQTIINAIMLNRSGIPQIKTCSDESHRFSRRSEVELHIVYSFPDFPTWHSILDQISDALVNGDKTLGGCCLTYSLPQNGESVLASFNSVDCHSAIIKLTVEESGILGGLG